jgi:hypothetical protein
LAVVKPCEVASAADVEALAWYAVDERGHLGLGCVVGADDVVVERGKQDTAFGALAYLNLDTGTLERA